MASVAMPLVGCATVAGRLAWRGSGGFRGGGDPTVVSCLAPPRERRSTALAVRAGLPPVISSVPVLGPLLNTLLSPVILFAVYAIGATRFFSGFSNTAYTDSLPTKLVLTLAWPVLFIASQKYRNNFKRAVR